MASMPNTATEYLDYLSLVTGADYSDQQYKVVENFDKNMIVFADPGTGKTHTVLAGLFVLLHVHKIPAANVLAMSFTKAAAGEMAARYEKLCEKMRIRPRMKFRTIHSLSWSILFNNAGVFGKQEMGILKPDNFASRVELVEIICKDYEIDISQYTMRKVAIAIKSLNSTFTFNKKTVTDSSVFKDCNIEFETFEFIRYKVYRYHRISGKIPRGDLCMYALDALLSNVDVAEKYRESYDVLVIDEAQDLSLIQLKLLSLICKKLIIVGDMKQQIHGYAGACPEVVEWYKTFFPDHVQCELTQSYRNADGIADVGKRIIHDNNMGGESFTGTGKSSTIQVSDDIDFHAMVGQLKADLNRNNGAMPYQLMFLYRNNVSEVTIAEELWRAKIPCKIEKHINATEIPIIEDLVKLTELSFSPRITYNLEILMKIVPEFQKYEKVEQLPIFKIMKKEGCDFFSCNYDYRGNELVLKLIRAMQEIHERRSDPNFKVREAFNMLYKYYYPLYLKGEEYKLDMEPSYYTGLAAPILMDKTFRVFKQDEADKQEYIEEQMKTALEGVRCLTMHSAKGTESDRVVILDVNEGLIPQTKRLDKLVDKGCMIEAAKMLRNERSLLFVAVTRARNHLVVNYKGELADLFLGETKYSFVDEHYMYGVLMIDELASFLQFTENKNKH